MHPYWQSLVGGLLIGMARWLVLASLGPVAGISGLGSGCNSGHGVCGLGRRSARSLVAMPTLMGAGVATVL